jgi:peptide/nickel transport system substrate-binding protein
MMTRHALAYGLLVITFIGAGCGQLRPPKRPVAGITQTRTVPDTLPRGSDGREEFSIRASASFPNPGPFQTFERKASDGSIEECMQARGEVGTSGGTLTLSTFGGGPKTFNCWAASDVESGGIGLLQYERLVELDPWTKEYYPRLAKHIEISKDGKEYTFTLRKGLKWSDNKPLNADDVVFTFDKLVREGFGTGSVSMRDILTVNGKFPTVEKIDNLTVRFKTAVPFAPFLAGIRSAPIAPKHVLEPLTKRPQKEFEEFWDVSADPRTLVASGPFILKRYVAGQRVELERNPNYFMVDKNGTRLPYLNRFVEAIVPAQNTQIIKFYGNELDMLDIRSVRGADVALMKPRQKRDNFTMYNLGPDDGTTFLMFNMCRRKNDKGKYYVDPLKQEWFNNQKFRQAVSHAIDRQRIIDNVSKGIGTPLFTAESPAAIFVNTNLKPYDSDLVLSARLLKEAGFVLRDGEKSEQFPAGRLYDAHGNAVTFTLLTNAGNPTREGTCLRIKDILAKLGIKVNFQAIDFNVLVDKTETSLDWEAIVMSLSGDKIEPFNGANVMKSTGRLHMFDQRLPDSKGVVTAPDARDWEKRIDKLFDQGATVLGFEKRKPYYWEYQQIIYDQQPFIYIYSILDVTAIRNTIGNYKPMPLGVNYTPMGSLHNIEEIYFRTAQK